MAARSKNRSRRKRRAPKSSPAAPSVPPSPTGDRALLIDPNRGALTRTGDALRGAGLGVIACARPGDALDALGVDDPPGVVVLTVVDESQPEEIAHAIEALPAPRPALIALFPRGFDVIEMESASARLGAQGALARPIPLRALALAAISLARMVRAQRDAQSLTHTMISERSERDPLDPRTNLYRFEHFKPLLAAELKRARRYGLPFTLLRVALDAMVDVELAHGPELAETLEGGLRLAVTRALRDQDFAVDLGPGQLLAVLPHTPTRGARVVAERIRRRVSKTRLTLLHRSGEDDADSVGTTASIGLAVYPGEGEISFAQLVRQATLALEIAQDAGGNRAAEVPVTRRAAKGKATESS